MDGTGENQGNSSGDTQGTSGQGTETFTKEQVTKMRSDALAEVGRYKIATEKAIKAAEAAEERLNRQIKDFEESELEAARDDTDALSRIKSKQKQREQESKLAEKERELSEKEAKVNESLSKVAEYERRETANRVAAKHSVNLETLLKFTDGSSEAMEELALSLPKRAGTSLIPDSGKTTGSGLSDEAFIQKLGAGGNPLTKEDLERAKKLGITR